jgi:beta-galactosidase
MTERHNLDRDWSFRRLGTGEQVDGWAVVELPHNPFVADLDGRAHWLGECEYRRRLRVEAPRAGVRHVLYVGAAMHSAKVLVDECEIAAHSGGYLPFEVDLTAALADGAEHVLTLRLDNRDNPDVPPGKPYDELDFCWYGGLYREAELRVYPEMHVTDPVAAGEPAGGGVFVRTLSAAEARAVVSVKTHVRNAGGRSRSCEVRVEILSPEGQVVATGRSPLAVLPAGQGTHVEMTLTVERPQLWSIATPALHEVRVVVCSPDGARLDERRERFGIRRIAFSRSGGFQIKGHRLRLRGTNRHQEMPFVGYAAPRAAQWRDARRIKEAGFDYVRLSHYPQSPHFLDACDALGIVVMNAIPGWQFIGGERFREACYRNARELIRRDRNHPCVVLWELSLNETAMDEEFMARLHAIGHEEFPGDQMFTCGWMDRYDVFVHSRQHGRIHTWANGDKALVIAEYGDWEFYAANEGFDQKTGAGVHAAWSNARQFRSSGERGLRQQASNHIVALNDTLASPAVLDGQWCAFDYARGYHPVRAACGVMDVFRLPKFSYHFYRSQRGPQEQGEGWLGGPMVFIASHWHAGSDLRVVVFSNCSEVELRLNGASLGRRVPDVTSTTQHLPHPPFVFDLPRFTPGALEAAGFIGGRPVATHRVSTPGLPAKLEVVVDTLGIVANKDEPDVILAHARILDAHGTLCVEATEKVSFGIEGDGTLVGPLSTHAEAGVASVVVQLPGGAASFTLRATRVGASGSSSAKLTWETPAGQPRCTAAAALLPI